jgi:hypothetical protein
MRTSPPLEKATTDGVVRDPSALGMTTGSPASRTATTELVVPRSMPTALGMVVASGDVGGGMDGSDSIEPHSMIKVECIVRNFDQAVRRPGRGAVGRAARAAGY